MGCISSKLLTITDTDTADTATNRAIATHHVVLLTSSTYGLLELDRNGNKASKEEEEEQEKKVVITNTPLPKQQKKKKKESLPEIINTWELMKDLSDSPASAKLWTPRKPRGKENAFSSSANSTPREISANRVLRPFSSAANKKPSPLRVDFRKDRGDCGSKRSLSPLFDPELVASFEKERVPPGGDRAAVLYTTTLRGIRKTFEECNAVRDAVDVHAVRVVEKDVSMDSGFLEEMRAVMGRKDVTPPLLFVKGRLVGGAEAVLKLEEEGKLGELFVGMPKREERACAVCRGVRFVMCRECNGSRKGVDTVKCERCNENGLVRCPKCTC